MNINEMNIIEDIQEDEFEAILNRAVQVDVRDGRISSDSSLLGLGRSDVEKITAAANKAWEKAGNPLDTENIRNILKSVNVSDIAIDDALQNFESRSARASGTDGIPKDTWFETTSSASGSHAEAKYKWDGTKWIVERAGRWVDTDENNTTDPFIGKSDKDIYALYYRAVRLGKAFKPDGRPPPEPTAPVAEPVAPSALNADMEMQELAKILTDSGMILYDSAEGIKIPNEALRNHVNDSNIFWRDKITEQKTNMENEMRVDEMCGGGCGDEMEMPKTNYNLSVTKDEGSTHKTMTVTSDQPDELIRVLQLSGMDTGHSEPDGDEIAGVDMDHDEPSSVSSMKDLISKVSHPPVGHDEAVEEIDDVEQDHSSDTKTFGLKDLVIGQTKKQPRQRRVAAHHGDNPYKNAGQLEEEYTAAYDKYKTEK